MNDKLELLFQVLASAKSQIGHTDYVIVGSLSVLGVLDHQEIPERMSRSNDFDAYTKADPDRIFDVAKTLGEGSAFFDENDVYLDPVSPKLLTLPEGWEQRLRKVTRDGVNAFFLDLNDAAVSKYARGAENDLRWIRAGVEAGLINLDTVRDRLRTTSFLDAAESEATRRRVELDLSAMTSGHAAKKKGPWTRSRP